VLFHHPLPPGLVSPAIRNILTERGVDVRIALPSIWNVRERERSLTNLILDSTVNVTQEDLNVVALFCLNNGLALDIWARSVPALELVRAAALTGGKVIFSLLNPPDRTPPQSGMQIHIPLPQELSSSGYPGRSMLSLFLDVGLMHTRDWLPLWPDMLEN
jgi:hypothetical protein